MCRLLGVFLLLAGTGVLYLAASADRPAQNEPEALRTETIDATARGAWRAIADTVPTAEPAPSVVIVTPAARTPLPAAYDTHKPPADRTVMTRDLQRELKRVGCYEGEIHGVWTRSTRDAMVRFAELVNAKLPTNEADIVLLSLVRGYAGTTGCGQSVITAAAPNVAPSLRAPTLDGYMALAGPPVEAPVPGAAPYRGNPRTSDRQTSKSDWVAELWRNQAN